MTISTLRRLTDLILHPVTEKFQRLYLLGLAARCTSVSAMCHKVFTVIPQQTVWDRSDELFCSPGDIFTGKRSILHHLIHVVNQHLGAICKVLQRVHAHGGTLGDAAEDESLVGDDRADELLVVCERGEDVGNQVGNRVIA